MGSLFRREKVHCAHILVTNEKEARELLAELRKLFSDRLSTAQAIREHHGRDESSYDPMLPDAVLFAQSTEDVAQAVALCNRYRFPVIAFGTGTSLEGHVLALQGGLSIDL